MSAPKFPSWMKVFPITPNAKTPLPGFTDWPARASNDPAQIAAWTLEYPNANWALACGPSGVVAIDVDGLVGENSLSTFELENEFLPATLEQKTPRGNGRHLIFKGDCPNSVGKLGPKLDTRGQHGYVLIAPSVIDGVRYQFPNKAPLAELPASVPAALGRDRIAATAAANTALDSDINVARAKQLLRDYIARGHVAIEGQGGDELTYSVCAEVQSLGLTPEKTLEIVQPWNNACIPPWSDDELRVKIENASLYAQNDVGAWAVPPVRERIPREALDKLLADSESGQGERTNPSGADGWTFGLHDPEADATLPPVTYRDARKLWTDSPGKTVSQVIAGPKQHKTNWIMAEMFRLMQAGAAKVLMLALEGGYGVRTMRLKALAEYYKMPLADLRGRFQVAEIKSGGMFDMSDPACVIALADFVKDGGWTDVFIDTQHRSAGALEENSATDARLFWNAVEVLRRRGNVNVTLAHHTGKDATKGGRGSSADLASVDQQIELSFDRVNMTVAAKVTARKDGADGFSVPFKVEQAHENAVPVIVPMSANEFQALAASQERFTALAVAAALQALERVGKANACSSRVLVQEILLQRGELPQYGEHCEKAITSGVRRLQERVQKDPRLQAYGRKDGGGIRAPFIWYLPTEEREAWSND